MTVSLTPDEARYLRQSWPMVRALSPALRAECASTRARFLLMDPAERTAMVSGTPGDAADHGDPEERILAYLAGHKELDARSGLPDELADLGMMTVIDTCEEIADNVGLYGSKHMRRFGLTDEGRTRIAPDFPEESVRYRIGSKITEYYVLHELDDDLGLSKGTALGVMKRFVESGYVVKDGSYYRTAPQAA